MLVAEEKNAKIEYFAEQKLLIQTWSGYVSSEVFRKIIDRTVAFFAEKPVQALISDTTLMSIVKKEDTEYAAGVMPALLKNGLRKMAFVLPESSFTKLSVKNFENQAKEKAPVEDELVKNFGNLKTAREWVVA